MAIRRRRRFGLSLAGVLVLLAAFVASPLTGAITYGQLDEEHTFVGAIIADLSHRRPDIGIIEWCSGTLVAAKVFLTAGHCTEGLKAWEVPMDRIWVSFDLDIFAEDATWRPISGYVTHPDYWWGPTSDPHDVAVVLLSDAVVGITPGKVAPEGFLDGLAATGELAGTWFVNSGYGSDEYGVVTGWREWSSSEFRNLHKAWLYMSQNIHTGSGGTCYGDSGGPTFYARGHTEYVVAVTSWGDAQCKATNNNYRVDIPSSQAFLLSYLED